MEERAWKVTLADGTSLGSLKLNGNNFISTTEVTKEMFEDNLTEVTIEGGDTIEKHENMELVQISKMGEDWWFILRDIPAEELEQMALKAQLDYLSMMVDPERKEEFKMANHSKKFNDVRSYYKYHMWKKRQVVNAVKQGWITEYEYEEITGESYPVQKEEEVAVAAAPVTETPQVPVTAETESNAKGASEEADVTSEE